MVLMKDSKTDQQYVLKVYGSDSRYTAELGLSRLKGPYFVTPICTVTVRLPIRVGSLMDTSDYEDEDNYIEQELIKLEEEEKKLKGEHIDKESSEKSQSLSRSGSDRNSFAKSTSRSKSSPLNMINLENDFQDDARYKFVTRPSIIMEWIDGEQADVYAYKLGKSIGPLGPPCVKTQVEAYKKLAHLFAELFVALSYIHATGAIYHDLKPENLMVREGHLVMLDFDSMSPRGAPYKGSSPTTAPEQWQVLEGHLHGGADFWAFGATCAILMSNLCAGMYYFSDRNLASILRRYSPLEWDEMRFSYVMMPLPYVLGESARNFLFPFFSPDPDARQFNTEALQKMVKKMDFVSTVDWEAVEKPEISSPFHKMNQEEIRRHFLKASDRVYGQYDDNYRKMVMPQMLYGYGEYMSATDMEADGNVKSKQKVADLVGIHINRYRRQMAR